MSVKLFIDGDLIVFRAGFATEKTKYLVQSTNGSLNCDEAKEAKAFAANNAGVIWSRKDLKPVEEALQLVDIIMGDIRARYNYADHALFLSPSVGNFRERISTRAKYKGNRDGSARPTHHKAISAHLVSKWGAKYAVGQEADDCLGIAMSAHPGGVCVSYDKDLKQLPGRHYDWTTKTEVTVSKREGSLAFYSQALSGDSTDNIPGLEGIGPAKAAKLLEKCDSPVECWQVVQDAYVEKYGMANGINYAVETATLVYVRRKENEVWSPPK